MAEADKEPKQPEEQQPSGEPTEETKEASNPEKGDGKVSKSSSASQDDAAPFLGSYGNAAGNKLESALSSIGRPVGKGFETVTKPVGGVVDALVGGVMRGGATYGEIAGVGAGNMDKKKAEEKAERHKEVGGKEQTGENPLGLNL